METNTPENLSKEQYLQLKEKAAVASTEEEVISAACDIIDFDVAMNRTAMPFIADLTKEGPTSENAKAKVLELVEKIKTIYEDKGYTVSIDQDPADFRDIYFTVEKK